MADEVSVSFMLPGEPAANVAAWRAQPPPFLDDYKRVDESYESLVYEANVTTAFMKVAMFGFGKTLYRLTFTFRAARRRDTGDRARPGAGGHRADDGAVGSPRTREPELAAAGSEVGEDLRPSWPRTPRR